MTPNLADAAAFLAMLGTRHTFQCFDDSKAKRRALSRVLHGTLEDHAETLADLNRRGAGVFVMANQGNGRGRKTEHVTGVRALFIDLDGAPLEPAQAAPLPPHCIVQTSPGKWHCWWKIADCSLDQFTSIQKALSARFGGDPSVSDLPRVMRVAGFWHCKNDPFLSELVSDTSCGAYTVDEVRHILLPDINHQDHAQVLPRVISEGSRNISLFTAAQGLVKRGHSRDGVKARLDTINAERCSPPLAAAEVDSIAANAARYGSTGFMILPHRMYDSDEWRSLEPAAQVVVLEAFRRFDGNNNGSISLSWQDFGTRSGFARDHTFYRARKAACVAGFLVEISEARLTQRGRIPTLFAIPERWLHESANPLKRGQRKPPKRGSYIDGQLDVDVAYMGAQNGTKGATR